MIILLTGKSGSGKTEAKEYLIKEYGYKDVENWTSRDKRPGETDYKYGHKQEIINMFMEDKMVEMVKFGEHLYGIKDLEDNSAVIVEPKGAIQVIDWCINNKIEFITIYIDTKRRTRLERCGGDESRINRDTQLFNQYAKMCDHTILNEGSKEDMYDMLNEILNYEEVDYNQIRGKN